MLYELILKVYATFPPSQSLVEPTKHRTPGYGDDNKWGKASVKYCLVHTSEVHNTTDGNMWSELRNHMQIHRLGRALILYQPFLWAAGWEGTQFFLWATVQIHLPHTPIKLIPSPDMHAETKSCCVVQAGLQHYCPSTLDSAVVRIVPDNSMFSYILTLSAL